MPSVGEKVKALRNYRKLNQLDFSAAIMADSNRVVEVECGRAEYNARQTDEIKKLFDIVDMPLDDSERPAFVRRLYLWCAYMKKDLTGEAVKMRDELSKIVNLEPCDYDLAMLYKILEVRMLVSENRLAEAEDKIGLIPAENLNNENLYHYYYVKGYISYEDCLDYLLQANDLLENHVKLLPEYDITQRNLYYNIAGCYSYCNVPYRAISFLLKAKEMPSKDIIDSLGLYIDLMLAQNYIRVNSLSVAEKLLRNSLIEAQSAKDSLCIGRAMHQLGCLYKANDDHKTALSHLDNALMYLPEDSEHYSRALYDNIHSYIRIKKFSMALRLLEPVRIKYSADETWCIYFEALWHYCTISRRMSVKNKESCEYIENVAIPYCEKNSQYLQIVEYCELLEQHYDATKSHRNALRMARRIRDIYKRCFVNPVRSVSII